MEVLWKENNQRQEKYHVRLPLQVSIKNQEILGENCKSLVKKLKKTLKMGDALIIFFFTWENAGGF